jgi:hypothetical protein
MKNSIVMSSHASRIHDSAQHHNGNIDCGLVPKRTSALLLPSDHPLRHINAFGWPITQAPAPSFGSRNSATFERSWTGE